MYQNEQQDGPAKQFIHYNETYYRQTDNEWTDEVTFACQADGDHGEAFIRWYNLDDGRIVAPRLEAHDDAWSVLYSHCQDVLEVLARYPEGLTPEVFCQELAALGYADVTPRKDPYTE